MSAVVLALALAAIGTGAAPVAAPAGWLAPAALAAQERPDTLVVPEPPISPGQAFLRALMVPGWGHASLGSYTRGGFYVAAEATATFMMVRVSHRRSAAEAARDLRIDEVERRARAEGVTEPEEIQARVDADEGVDDARQLVEARDQQFEDWLALGVFLVLMGGADAYVSAHLTDFPRPVEVRPTLTGTDRYGVAVSIPVGGRPGR